MSFHRQRLIWLAASPLVLLHQLDFDGFFSRLRDLKGASQFQSFIHPLLLPHKGIPILVVVVSVRGTRSRRPFPVYNAQAKVSITS